MIVDPARLPEPMRRRLAAEQAESPVSHVRNFLQGVFADAISLDEVRDDLHSLAQTNTRSIHLDLTALERVIVDPTLQSEFARLVGWDANWVLPDPSDAGAKRFLEEVVVMLRTILDSVPDPWLGAYDLRPPRS